MHSFCVCVTCWFIKKCSTYLYLINIWYWENSYEHDLSLCKIYILMVAAYLVSKEDYEMFVKFRTFLINYLLKYLQYTCIIGGILTWCPYYYIICLLIIQKKQNLKLRNLTWQFYKMYSEWLNNMMYYFILK